jgi:hypothetical protein
MLTATPARAQQLAPLSLFLMIHVGAVFMPACYQAPPQAQSGEFTSSPAASGNAASGNVASTPTPTTMVPANGTGANQPADLAVGGMTLTPLSNPFICLGADAVVAGAPVTLSTCNQTSRQHWLLRNGRLQLASNLCVTFAATGTAALHTTPILAACNANDMSQNVARGSSATLVMNTDLSNYAIAAQVPTASNSNVTFENVDPNILGQKWVLGADNAASGSLQAGTFKIAPTDSNSNCLTVAGMQLTQTPCASGTTSQGFRWNDAAQLIYNDTCLTASASSAPKLTACNVQDGNQRWYSISGQLANAGTASCLDSNGTSLVTCPTDNTLRFDIGALPKN